MGAILFIIFAVLLYTFKIIANARNLTFDKWCEIFISFFIFTNCVSFGLPLIDLNLPYNDGAFGYKFRLEVFMIIAPIFLIVMARRMKWQFLPIPWYAVAVIVLYCAVNLLNPNNLAVPSTAIAIAQLLSYALFLYLLCSCVSLDVILKGIYEGFLYTTILQAVLAICYPILGIDQVVHLFREATSIRAEARPGAPGTFTHPNSLGGYMAYIVSFFTACYFVGYQKKKSLWIGITALFVLIMSFSRTSMLAVSTSLILLITLYTTQNSSIFSLKNILTKILPFILIIAAAVLFTPLKNSFINSDMDEMMLARLMHYYCGYEIITDHPWVGVGLNSHLEYIRANISFRIFGDVSRIIWRAEEFMSTNPIHNVLLIWLSEFGIILTLPILFFFGRCFYKIKPILRSNASDNYKVMYLFSIGLITCLLVHGMADWAPLSRPLCNIWLLAFFVTSLNKYKNEGLTTTG